MKKKILILAQTPPPFHGQSIMQQYLVEAKWPWCQKIHIRMDFSEKIDAVTRFNFSKVLKLFRIIILLFKERLKGPIDIIYYPPSGPHRVSFYRDLILVPFIKLFSIKVVFHFHSGGFNQIPEKFNFIEIALAKIVYYKPELAIALLPSLEDEVQWIAPKKIIHIPNGIEDVFDAAKKKSGKKDFVVLFVGNLIEEKGIVTLVEAMKKIGNNIPVKLKLIGGWRSKELKKQVEDNLVKYNLQNSVEFAGIKNGEEKWKYFNEADIFCLPTFETEAMPITIIEAMMFGLPVITTNWRAIPDIIQDGADGMLIPVKDPDALAAKIIELFENKELRAKLGNNARINYLKSFRIENHLKEMEKAFKQL